MRARGRGRGGPKREPNALGLRLAWLGGHVVWSSEDLPLPWEETPPRGSQDCRPFSRAGAGESVTGRGTPSPCCRPLGAHGWVRGGRGKRWAPGVRSAALVPRGAAVSASLRDGGLSV